MDRTETKPDFTTKVKCTFDYVPIDENEKSDINLAISDSESAELSENPFEIKESIKVALIVNTDYGNFDIMKNYLKISMEHS